MFYKELANVASQFNREDLDIDGVLQAFCMRRFADRRFFASFFLEIEQDGQLRIKGFFGANPMDIGIANGSLSIFDDHPAAESIRKDSKVVTKAPKSLATGPQSMIIAWPVESDSRILGSVVTISDSAWDDSEASAECLEALVLLINRNLIRLVTPRNSRLIGKANHHSHQDDSLSERQEVILKLISEGRTNGDIAQILGYSESLIRQETIRIYAHLGCNGRQEAAQIYLSKLVTP